MPSTTTGSAGITFDQGDVVLLPFPFTDLSASKTRPAIVVSTSRFTEVTGDVTAVMITSLRRDGEFDCELKDWQEARLLEPSWMRAKVATLDPSLVRYRPGRLSTRDLESVMACLRRALGLSSC